MLAASSPPNAPPRALEFIPRPASTLRGLVVTTLALSAMGCISTQTHRSLSDAYAATSRSLDQRAPRATASPEVAAGSPLDRDAVVALAVSRSPSLAAAAHRARALIHAGRAEGSLPSPEVGVQITNLPLTRPYAFGDAGMYMLEFRQRFPAAAALDGRARAMSEEARAALAELSTEERMTAQRAADAFVEYVLSLQEQSVETRQLALLEQMGGAVRARYSTGGATLTDAPRIELEVATTRRAIARTEGDLLRVRAALNALLRRPSTAALGVPRELPPETIRLAENELLARATANRGALLAADARVRAARARRQAADAEARVPEFMVGFDYFQDPSMRPGIGAMFSMSLPWLWGPQHERAAQAQEAVAAEASTRDSEGIEARSEITEELARLRSAEGQLLVVDDQALPAARRAIDALGAQYATGSVSLLEWVDAARAVLALELERVALGAELAHAVAALERAVGAPLPRVPFSSEERP